MTEKKYPRPGSMSDEDRGAAAIARRRTPGNGVDHTIKLAPVDAVPDEIDWENVTQRYDGPDLDAMRARRAAEAPEVAIVKLEAKVEKSVNDLRVEVTKELGDVKSGFGALAGEVKGLSTVVRDALDRQHVKFTATVEVDKAEKIDGIAKRKGWRDLGLRVAGALFAGGIAAKALEMLLAKIGVL